MSSVSPSRYVSFEQVKTIVDFMGQHVEFATGRLRTLEARQTSKKLWSEVTKALNSCKGGTKKDADGWSKYWSIFKNKLKNKAKVLKRKKSGSSSKTDIKSLTKLEKRALAILAPHFEKRRDSEDQTEDPIDDSSSFKVKQELYDENQSSDYEKEHYGGSVRLSVGEKESDRSSKSCDEDFVEDIDEPANGHLLQNFESKWLIEMEKKRVDAELLRARAEEKRATVAVKNAEAAIAQAEALKKLSEATNRQAEALTRIATLLENRGCRDVLLNL